MHGAQLAEKLQAKLILMRLGGSKTCNIWVAELKQQPNPRVYSKEGRIGVIHAWLVACKDSCCC